ncbi:Asp_protease_2 domain-containing protein [Cucumis melo var. makuwa]|uniref:Asp_protease_2 domain-containing protein n=1 Tax=Cucumis melo var. makuwa TaxID=1194695 RepID=A0A5D3DAG4_CUCMM|nr:Asp_protease_2 domain-containing protein [Cucumis melo var. makuwa]
MLYLAEVPDSIHYLESRLEEISKKAGTIDAFIELCCPHGRTCRRARQLSEDTLRDDKWHAEDFRVTLDVVRNEIAYVNARLNLTMQAMANQGRAEEAISVSKYFKATNTITEEAKVALATMHLFEDAKLWWRAETVAKTKLYEQRVQDLTLAYPAVERLFDLTSDSQDVRRDQSSSPRRNRNSRSSSPKDAEGGKDFGRDRRPYQSNTENTQRRPNNRSPPKRPLSCFTCEGPYLARECLNKVYRGQTSKTPLGEGFRKNESREYCCPTFRRASETTDDKVGRVERLRRLCGCKDGDFDIVLGIEFLLEHQVIPMPSPKCLVITGSLPTVVQADIRQPNRFKVISAIQLDESLVQEEPPSATILLGALRKLGETVLKDTLCVPEKYHG